LHKGAKGEAGVWKVTWVWLMFWVFLAGLVGGLINAYFAEQGLKMWKFETLPDGSKIFRPGFVGNVIVGGITALILTFLNYPQPEITTNAIMTVQQFVGALAAGVGGARILSQEIDLRYDRVSQRKLNKAVRNTDRP
jgi:fructose-specific phosphotransferase system IIC component